MIALNGKRRAARLLGAVSVAVVAFGLLPVTPAAAAIVADDACASSPEDGFVDTGLEDTDDLPNDVEDTVDCLSACAITAGQVGSALFGTGNLVNRAQLATFVMNVLDRVDGFTRPANPFDQFPDDEDSVHEENINDAAALDIIRGYPDGTYRPAAPVSRAQMATFLVNTLEEAGVAVPSTTRDAFTDDEQSVHEANINRLEALDVVDGEGPGIYNPERSVTRGTMAFFLTRTYELIVEAGLADPCAADTTAPTATDADFIDVGTDGVFGGGTEFGDVITFRLDEVVPTEDGDTVTIDGVVLTCNVNVGCTPNTLTDRIGFTAGVLTPAIPITLGTSSITATSIDDAAGNAVNGLPTIIDPD